MLNKEKQGCKWKIQGGVKTMLKELSDAFAKITKPVRQRTATNTEQSGT